MGQLDKKHIQSIGSIVWNVTVCHMVLFRKSTR